MPAPAPGATARSRRRASAALLLALLTLLGALAGGTLVAAPAGAHDRLVSSDPADGAVLDAPPAALTLQFSAEVLPTGAQVVLTDASGADAGASAPQVAGTAVTAALPADLAAGAYTVAWRVVSSDGHPIEGTFGFTLEGGATPSPTATEASAPPPATATDAPAPATATRSAAAASSTAHAGHEDGATGPWVVGGLLVLLAAAGTAAVTAARRRAEVTRTARRDDGPAGG
ncbi:copper resistance protein CopC [Puerhibacterium sp. TATVAM-FAB25]|uniref:copper resistance CopC family protein n=1 Tax=Puerhibacterium sp. TATVAM-FAB25 TaxID=3093699 RepID=UPI00397B4723